MLYGLGNVYAFGFSWIAGDHGMSAGWMVKVEKGVRIALTPALCFLLVYGGMWMWGSGRKRLQ